MTTPRHAFTFEPRLGRCRHALPAQVHHTEGRTMEWLGDLVARDHENRCDLRLRTTQCVRASGHIPGCVFVASEYGNDIETDGFVDD